MANEPCVWQTLILRLPSRSIVLQYQQAITGNTSLLSRSVAGSGREPKWAFSMFRIAAIFQGIAKRALEGTAANADASDVGRLAGQRKDECDLTSHQAGPTTPMRSERSISLSPNLSHPPGPHHLRSWPTSHASGRR